MNKKKILSVLFAGVLCLSPLGIQASTTYATSEDGSKKYTSIDDAWDAAQDGIKIVMQQDWNISSRLVLDSNTTATIEMNGHKISRGLSSSKSNGEVIKLCSNSTLNLNGKNAPSTVFNFNGYVDGISAKCSTNSGGLITGGYSTNGGGGIHMKSGSKLNLDSVSISGNKSNRSLGSDGHGGAIYMDGKEDKVNLVDSEITFNASQRDGGAIYVNNASSTIQAVRSSIVNNTAGASLSLDDQTACGGAIAIDDNDVSISLEDSKIDDNYANAYGGGIYSNGKNTQVTLNASSISFNRSDNNGGGIYFNYSNFKLESKNHDGQISHNNAQSNDWGGAVYAARCYFSGNSGKIDGITFDSNSAYAGGAINIHQENVTVSNCTFTNNDAYIASAIEVDNDDFVLENSTIQNNTTHVAHSAAVVVDGYNDLTLNGIVNITNNPNTDLYGDDADLLLYTIGVPNARILNVPDTSSRIGLLVDDDRTLAKNQTSDAFKIYFVNNPSKYEISYDSKNNEIVSNVLSDEFKVITAQAGIDEDTQDTTEAEAQTATESTEAQSYTITLNMVNEAGTWQNTEKMSIEENSPFELQAPIVEDKTFVEFKDLPETLTIENDIVKADSITSDMEITIVYKDSDSEESTNTASIFGDSNALITTIIIIGIVAVGAIIFIKKKK